MSVQALTNFLAERSDFSYHISVHHGLLSICLSYSQLDNEDAIAIFDLLENVPNINSLEIRSNSIGDKGAIAIADFIDKDQSCNYLDLTSNIIGSKGATAIFNTLGKNKRIKVNIENNPISDNIKKLLKGNDRFSFN